MRNVVVLLLVATLSVSAAPPKPKPAPTVAPEVLPHSIALFLGSLCNEGGRQVTFKAHRLAADRWRFVPADGGVETTVDLDEDGIPVLTAGATWALEQSHDA